MFEMANVQEDALREYDELEQIYLEMGNAAVWSPVRLSLNVL